MVQVLHSGLYNDDESETLPVSSYADKDKTIVSKYKIININKNNDIKKKNS